MTILELDQHQNVTWTSLSQGQSIYQDSWKCVHEFVRYPLGRQTDKVTGRHKHHILGRGKLSSGVLKQDHCYSLISTMQTVASSCFFHKSRHVLESETLRYRNTNTGKRFQEGTQYGGIYHLHFISAHFTQTVSVTYLIKQSKKHK